MHGLLHDQDSRMRTQIRIIAGSLRGRKLTCTVNENLRPTPQRVREALFSILGDAVPGRPFFDLFAGTGVIGLEAISRGATLATFVERDFRLIDELEKHFKAFKVGASARILRTDTYRWAERWQPPKEPANVFLSPPFADLSGKSAELLSVVSGFQARLAPGSVLILQAEPAEMLAQLPDRDAWDERVYGRNHLLFWVRPGTETELQADEPSSEQTSAEEDE
jgi:16S rRNA (guanine966-N2)-methyltransferase